MSYMVLACEYEEYEENRSDTGDTEDDGNHNTWNALAGGALDAMLQLGKYAGWHCRVTLRWTSCTCPWNGKQGSDCRDRPKTRYLYQGVESRGATATREWEIGSEAEGMWRLSRLNKADWSKCSQDGVTVLLELCVRLEQTVLTVVGIAVRCGIFLSALASSSSRRRKSPHRTSFFLSELMHDVDSTPHTSLFLVQ